MSGRRRTGNALAAGVNVLSGAVQTDIQRQFDTESEGRKFRQKLVELGIQGKLPGVEANPHAMSAMTTGQPFQGPMLQPRSQNQLSPFLGEGELPAGTTVTQTIKTPQGTITIKRGGAAQKLTETEATRLQLGAQPGQPYPQLAQPPFATQASHLHYVAGVAIP